MIIPAYMQIRQYAVDLVLNSLHKEEKILSERELCDLFGVTRPTVRKALKDLVDDEYLRIKPGLGTYTNPAKAINNVSFQDAFSLGIVVGDGKLVNYDCYFGDIIVGALSYVNKHGGLFRILNISQKGNKAVDEIMLMNISGLIWINPPVNMYRVCEELDRRGFPVMTVGRSVNGTIDNSSIDFFHEGYIVAQYFLKKGHSNIVCAAFDSKCESDKLRIKGLKQAFKDAGKEFNDKMILKTQNDIASDLHKMIEFGIKFSGIYATGIYLHKVLDVLTNEDLVLNQDVLVIGNEHVLRGIPEVNCARLVEPLEKLGWSAAENLANKISGQITNKIELKLKPHIEDKEYKINKYLKDNHKNGFYGLKNNRQRRQKNEIEQSKVVTQV